MAGISSFGTLLEWFDGTNWVTIGGVQDIEGPSVELGTEETTTHDDPQGWATYVGTVLDGGEVSFTVQYIPSSAAHAWSAQGGLPYMMQQRTPQQFRIVPSDSSYTNALQFTALVTQFAPKFPVKGSMTADVTLKVTGPITEVAQ